MEIVLAIILIIASVALVITILFQTGGKSSKLSQTIAGGSSENYAGKNKQRFKDKKLSKYTTFIAIGFVVVLLIAYIVIVKSAQKKEGDETDAGTTADTTVATESGDATGENEIDFGELTGNATETVTETVTEAATEAPTEAA